MKEKGFLLDVQYYSNSENKSVIQLFLKTVKGIQIFEDKSFSPYFYVILEKAGEKHLKELKNAQLGSEKIKTLNAFVETKKSEKNVVKLEFNSVKDLTIAREEIKKLEFVLEKREYDIPFTKRYLIDKDLSPLELIEVEFKEENGKKIVEEIKKLPEKSIELNLGAFDLETHSPGRFSDATKDPILMIAYVDEKEKQILTWKHKELSKISFVKVFETEKEMLEFFVKKLKEKQLDGIITYNGDSFDFPYLKERTRIYKIEFDIGIDGSEPIIKRKGMENAVQIHGTQHIDAYQMILLMNRFGTINLIKFDLETVYEKLFGEPKEKLKAEEINWIWKTGKELQRLVNYNLEDAVATYKITLRYLSLFIELGKLVKQPLFDVVRTAASNMVENLLIIKAFKAKELIPNKPEEGLVKQRMLQTFKGGYVKEPLPGLHENIAIMDFRSLYPSIMISHNISSDTLDCEHEKCKTGKNLAPTKHWFCEKEKGFLTSILEEILTRRIELKKQFKEEKNSDLKKVLEAKQHALKIVLNSFYGTLGYARFRWYSREAARGIAAWARHYVKEVIHKAEQANLTPIYGDSDSAFVLIPKEKSQENVKEFVKKINAELPEAMELELEGFYKRGIFVTKKTGEGAAKKKYALIDFNGNLKIVGFEYVRRDWSPIAKKTQKKTIELILDKGHPEEAVQYVKQVIKDLKNGKVPKKELIILNQIKKPIKSYESIGPHVAAAKKAIQRGKELGTGSIVGYIVTKGSGKQVSDKAELEEFVEEGNYDSDYYIHNQVIPAIIKIIGELGYSEQDLIQGGKQSNLSAFM